MDPVAVKTQPINRAKLAQWIPSHEGQRFLETLGTDVMTTLPSAVDESNAALSAAIARVGVLEGEVVALNDSITTLQVRVTALESQLNEVQDQSVSLLADLREQINGARRDINDLYSGPKP